MTAAAQINGGASLSSGDPGRINPADTISDLNAVLIHAPIDNVEVTNERLVFGLFLALVCHMAILLGVGFTFNTSPDRQQQSIEITLAQHVDQKAPEQADFLADANQLGSGTESEKRETTTDIDSDFQETEISEISQPPVAPMPSEQREAPEVLRNTSGARILNTAEQAQTAPPIPVPTAPETTQFTASAEIASLKARLAEQRQTYARAPRVRRLTSVSAQRVNDAYYLNAWRREIERVGNLNYPEDRRGRKLFGALQVLVAVNPDGKLHEVRILKSSGHPALDSAAIRIVQLAAPFAPFSPEMRHDTERLEIIRTWQFQRTGNSLGY